MVTKIGANGEGGIMDKDPHEDLVFSKLFLLAGRMSEEMYHTVLDWFEDSFKDKRKPDVVIYPPSHAGNRVGKRIRIRGREMEKRNKFGVSPRSCSLSL